MIGALIAASLRFRIILVAAAAGLVVLGVLSLRQMHTDVLPELGSGPVLEVQTEALGLSSQEVEQYVTVPLENNLLDGVMGVWDVRSQSIPGLSAVDLYFEPGVTTLRARQLVEERLTNAFSLPNVSQPPQLIQPLSSSSRVMMIGLSSRSVSPLELSYLARWIVKPRLSGVPGVANVTIFGQRDRQIQVLVDPSRLASTQVTLSQIIATAGNAQLVSPLSYLQGSSPGTGGFLEGPNQRLEIRPVLPLGAPRDLASVPISGAPGRLRLGSVAHVVLGNQPLIGDALTRSGAGIVLLVQKLPSASTAGVTKGIERALGDLRPALHGVSIDTTLFRPGTYVASALSNLALAAMIAGLLMLLALLAVFLRARAAVVTLVSVALALLTAALLLDVLGYTLNALVVLGLLVALAVIIDDAVAGTQAILANVRAWRAAPVDRTLAMVVIDACRSVRRTLSYATLIVLLCAAPPFFAKGLTATFVHPLLLSYALAVIASMAVALTVAPALALLVLDRRMGTGTELGIVRRLRMGYEAVLQRALAIPRALLAVVCLAGLIGIVALPFVDEPSQPTFRDRNLVVEWNGPTGAALREMDRITTRVTAQLRSLPAVADAGATLGRAVSADRIVDPSSGEIFVRLRPGADYQRAVTAVKNVVENVPGVAAHVSTYEANVMAGVLQNERRSVTVRVYGEDEATLGRLANQISSVIARAGGLGTPRIEAQPQEPNIEVRINDAAALRAGVLPGDARRQASTLVSGLTVGNFFQDQAVFDVVVRGVQAARANLGAVRDLLIDTSGGGHVRLGDIARITVASDPVDIRHEALSRYVDVTAPVTAGGVGAAREALRRGLARVTFPLDYHAEVVGGTPDDPTSRVTFLSFVLAAAVGILLLLQAAFGSWRLAALFFLTLPVALSGSLLVALAMGEAASLGTDAGLLAVYALAARQGMLTIANIRRLHGDDGGPLTPRLVTQAAGERFAPALGAVIVIACALAPFVALGDVPGNELAHVAAAVILGGLLSTTLLNLAVLPSVCLALGPTKPIELVEEDVADPVPAQAISVSAPTPSS